MRLFEFWKYLWVESRRPGHWKETWNAFCDHGWKIILTSTLVICPFLFGAGVIAFAFHKDPQVELQVFNPYRLQVRLEVKCDVNHKGQFAFHQWLYVPGKKMSVIRVPSNLKRCEIWPKIIF